MGERLGRYKVLAHLASGGMADVLLARADGTQNGIAGFERHVVLKRIRAEHARDRHFIGMFLDEARVAASLHHQNIVQVHDIGESGGEYFFAMEHIHGEDTRSILAAVAKQRAHVPLGVVVGIISAAASGLHYAHERRATDKKPMNIVHCDVSPSNILVGFDGAVKVVDFGIAKAALRNEETRTGWLKGKAAYMSPEQCQSKTVDRRSDVYSLGVVLYELATTTRLFKGDNDYLVMDSIVKGRVPLPRVRRPDMPNELAVIIMRALENEPNRRFQTADELRLALDQFAAQAGLVSSPSIVASYLRKLFGEKPEPWLDLPEDAEPETFEAPEYKSSWTDLPSDLAASGQFNAVGSSNSLRPPENARGSRPSGSLDVAQSSHKVAKMAVTPRGDTVPPEAPPQSRTRKAFTPGKLALIATPVVLGLGVAIWQLQGMGGAKSDAKAAAAAPSLTAHDQTVAHEAVAAAPSIDPAPAAAPTAAPISPATLAAPMAAAPMAAAAGAPISPATPAAPTAAAPSRLATPAAPSRPAPTAAAPSRPAAPTRVAAAAPAPRTPTARTPAAAPAAKTSPAAIRTVISSGADSAPPAAPSVAVAAPPPAPVAVAAPTPAAPTAAAPAPAIPQTTMTPSILAQPKPAVPVAAAPAAPVVVDAPLVTLASGVIDRVANAHGKELTKCEGSEALKGEITVRFEVGPNGQVTKSQIKSAMGKPKVAGCILRSLQHWSFPKQTSGAQGTYSLVFQ
ncbi:MAG TPA: protein kinase [Kofleriaceae bacterium]|jgi:serine/threonine protein kinase